jgi:cytochrome P450
MNVTSTTSTAPLPPPTRPRPVPGRRLAAWWATAVQTADYFLWSGPDAFLRHQQRRHGGTVFRVYLWRPVVALLDTQAISVLFDSPDLEQEYGFGWLRPPRALVGGVVPSTFENGRAHDVPKALYHDWLQSRLPDLGERFEASANLYLDRWDGGGRPFSFRDELEDFSAEFLFDWLLGARPDPADVRLLYMNLFDHRFPRLAALFPRSRYRQSLAAFERLLACVLQSPQFPGVLARARALGLDDAGEVARQMLCMIGMHAFLGLQSLLKSVVGELSSQPAWALRVRHEVITTFGPQPVLPALRRLEGLPGLDAWMREVLRLHPPVANVFARATRDRTLRSQSGAYAIRQGDRLMGAIAAAHRDPTAFDDPGRFDPQRFRQPADSHRLIWARGPHDAPFCPGNRTCPGKDVAVLVAKLFCAKLVTHTHWTLFSPPMWRREAHGVNAAAPHGPMTVSAFERVR